MLRIYKRENDHLACVESSALDSETPVVWFDLLNPVAGEDRMVEQRLGILIPTRAEMQEIEPSARLYHEDGAIFMTMTALTGLDGDDPAKTPVTFVLKGETLVTIRYAEPKPFDTYVTRAQRSNGQSCASGELVMLGLVEALIDRMADALERVGDEVDAISREVFRGKPTNATKKTHNLQTLIERIGRKGDFLTIMQESLVSIGRLMTYRSSLDLDEKKRSKEIRQRLKLIQRDASSLGDHAKSLSNKINFLLDATLGLINLQQSQIIKIFSVAAVVFLPPTLVASIYGMNFDYIPELKLLFGYPMALGVMVVSAILPYLYFKRRGWL